MKLWLPEGPIMQGPRFQRGPVVFRWLTRGNASRSIPRISRGQRQMAAVGCIWLRSATSTARKPNEHKYRSVSFSEVMSGGRGIRTHGDVAATMVFKTIAIGH
jgi:hypothetical protein